MRWALREPLPLFSRFLLVDSTGVAIEDKHDTTVGACSEPKYVTFNNKIHLRTSLSDLEARTFHGQTVWSPPHLRQH